MEEEKKLPTTTDAPRIDGFEGFSTEGDEQSANRVIQGKLAKFSNEATWESGEEELPSDLEPIVIDVGRVVQCWHDGKPDPEKTIILAPGEPWPDIKAMNAAVPQEDWEDGPDGKPRGPFQAQYIVYMLDPKTMDRYTFPTGTTGGGICVRNLVDATKMMRRFRGENVYPVVTLSDTFMPTRWGGRQRPHLPVKRWITFGDGGKALPAPDTPKLPDQGAKEVTPPSAKEVTGDSIPF
jgi:hypothetical protein